MQATRRRAPIFSWFTLLTLFLCVFNPIHSVSNIFQPASPFPLSPDSAIVWQRGAILLFFLHVRFSRPAQHCGYFHMLLPSPNQNSSRLHCYPSLHHLAPGPFSLPFPPCLSLPLSQYCTSAVRHVSPLYSPVSNPQPLSSCLTPLCFMSTTTSDAPLVRCLHACRHAS